MRLPSVSESMTSASAPLVTGLVVKLPPLTTLWLVKPGMS